jgi:hypothetical protein
MRMRPSVRMVFFCRNEVFPEVADEVDAIFRYARWSQRGNQLKQDPQVNFEVERLYRIAAAHGNSKANVNLQNGSLRGHFNLQPYEQLRFSQDLIEANVPSGYYFVAIFLQRGAAGLEQNEEMALRYYRKAADEGSPQAQHYVAQRLEPVDASPDIAFKMYRCAAEQGNGRSASILGIHLKQIGNYEEAVRVFQMGVSAGDDLAAGLLEEAFRGPQPDDKLYYAGQQEDLERADRYKKVWQVLANYSYASPIVPEIDEILPLPPAKLPAWNGKLQWLEERLENIPPPKPEEWLIERLAKEKGLDPVTGRKRPDIKSCKSNTFQRTFAEVVSHARMGVKSSSMEVALCPV